MLASSALEVEGRFPVDIKKFVLSLQCTRSTNVSNNCFFLQNLDFSSTLINYLSLTLSSLRQFMVSSQFRWKDICFCITLRCKLYLIYIRQRIIFHCSYCSIKNDATSTGKIWSIKLFKFIFGLLLKSVINRWTEVLKTQINLQFSRKSSLLK